MTVLYLDSSALAKLFVRERGSAELRRRVRGTRLVSSTLSLVEVGRVVRRVPGAIHEPGSVWRIVTLVDMDREVLRRAVDIRPEALRSLDAIHVATALTIAEDVDAFITYDRQLGRAAAAAGLTVEAPGT